MKVRIRHIVSGEVSCELRFRDDFFARGDIPFISVSSHYVIDYLTDDNVRFDSRTGEVLPEVTKLIYTNL